MKDSAELQKINEAYDSPSWWYDVRGFFILTLSYRDTVWHQVAFFGRNMRDQHLEIAIGSGTLLDIILRWHKLRGIPRPAMITGFDYAERMLAGAIKRFKNAPDIKLLRADASALEFHDNSFDTANLPNAFHCFPEPLACMKELRRVMKPGATMRMNVVLEPPATGVMAGIARRICAWGIQKGILFATYTPEQVLDICREAGFEIGEYYVKGYSFNIELRK